LSKGFPAGKEEAGDIQISGAGFYRKTGVAVLRNFAAGRADFRRHPPLGASAEWIGFERLSREHGGGAPGHDQVVNRGTMQSRDSPNGAAAARLYIPSRTGLK
jgi:hypothetical protein